MNMDSRAVRNRVMFAIEHEAWFAEFDQASPKVRRHVVTNIESVVALRIPTQNLNRGEVISSMIEVLEE